MPTMPIVPIREIMSTVIFFAIVGFIFWIIKVAHTVKTWKREDEKYAKDKENPREMKQSQPQMIKCEYITQEDEKILKNHKIRTKRVQYQYYTQPMDSTAIPQTEEKPEKKRIGIGKKICTGTLAFFAICIILALLNL